ncbi:hypothetical protein ACHAWF_017385 [Thalassiosira exigua]
MRSLASVCSAFAVASSASAFSPAAMQPRVAGAAPAGCRRSSSTELHQYQYSMAQQGLVDVTDVWSPRDVYSMEEWASQYGVQKADGVELYSEDGSDYSLVTNSGASAGQAIIFVPANVVLNSAAVQQEFGTSLQQAEEVVMNIDNISKKPQGADYRLSLFRLTVKVLAEYEQGPDSTYYPWLNSLPRQFYNGVSMTRKCFNVLPPYAGWLTSNERLSYSHFAKALKEGYVPLSPETVQNDDVIKWAYNVALTRNHDSWRPDLFKVIGPMADMLNHASEPNCRIAVDYEGNVNVVALHDIPAGSALTISLGDPTNPTPIFAQYGFLPRDCSTIFCKAMHLEKRIYELGYDFSELLFHTETGEISPKIDPGTAQKFQMACINGDEGTKEQCHGEHFAYTLDALKQHVYSILSDAERLTTKAQTYDLNTHPRVPVIVAHNQLVSQTFAIVASTLEQMG